MQARATRLRSHIVSAYMYPGVVRANMSAPQPSYFGIERARQTTARPSRGNNGSGSKGTMQPRASPSISLRAKEVSSKPQKQGRVLFHGVHHVALLCEDLDRSLQFYCNILGLEVNPDRPHEKLPYPGAWLWIGPEMIHLMQLPNPDPVDGRPEHGGRDRHFCVGVESIGPLEARLVAAGIEFTRSKSGRPAVFFRDPDMNCLEVVEQGPWR